MNHIEAYSYAESHPEEAAAAQETYQALLSRSATDLDFRQRLLADPAATVAEFTGREVPDTFNVSFIENRADATVVLPDYVDPSVELSEDELEAVAGGTEVGIALVVGGATLIVAGTALVTVAVLAMTESPD